MKRVCFNQLCFVLPLSLPLSLILSLCPVSIMLSRPLTLGDSDDRGRGLVAVTPPPVPSLVNEGDAVNGPQTGEFMLLVLGRES